MSGYDRLMENLARQVAPERSEAPEAGGKVYERMLILTRGIEEAVCILQQDETSTYGMSLLQAAVSPVVSEVHRVEAFLAGVEETPPAGTMEPNQWLREGLESVHAGTLELAACLEDLDAAHLEDARLLFRQGHLALQRAREAVEEALSEEAESR